MSGPDETIDTEIVEEKSPAPASDAPELMQALETTGKALAIRPITSVGALGAQLVASIHARYLMAERHPRDMETVRRALFEWCAIPEFAKNAIYYLPRGKNPDGTKKYLEGLSIRFAEMAVRAMGNILEGSMVISQDDEGRVIRVEMNDLESNIYYYRDVFVPRTVERRHPRDDQRVIRQRLNSEGQVVSIVEATEDEINISSAREISKAQRTLTLKIVPPDIKAQCTALIKETQLEEARKQPETVRRALVEAYAGRGITEADLAAYLGRPLDTITAEEIVELRAIFLAIGEGDATWQEIREVKRGAAPVEGKEPISSSRGQEILDQLAKRRSEVTK